MKKYLLLLLIYGSNICFQNTHAQVTDMGRKFSMKCFVQNIDYIEKIMIVNYIPKDKTKITSEIVKLDAVKVFNSSKDSIPLNSLKISDEILLDGQRFVEYKFAEAEKITLMDKSVDEIKRGRIDTISGGFAYIDGHKVKLAEGKKIKGQKKSGYEDKSLATVEELKPNDYANVDGKYNAAGYYLASEFSIAPYDVSTFELYADTVDRDYHETFYPLWNDKNKRARFFKKKIPGIGNISDNAALQDYVHTVGMKLVPDRLKKNTGFVFIVVENSDINANMRANGLCYVYTGLLKALDNEAQLATILGHEIGHVIYEHVSNEMKSRLKADKNRTALKDAGTIGKENVSDNTFRKKNKDQAASEKTATKETIDNTALLLTSYLERQESSYSVKQESQADRVGLCLMYLAGYDPRQAPIVWKNIYNYYGKLTAAGINNKLSKTLINEAKKEKPKDGKKKSDVEKGAGILNILLKWKAADYKEKSFETHPDHLTRFEELNRLVSLYWNNEAELQKAVTGAEGYAEVVSRVKKK